MKLRYKVLLGAAAVAVASAASFPNELGAFYLGPTSWQKREALSVCQQSNSTFVRFLVSDRDSCFSRMRTAVEVRTGLWSRHDRSNGRLAQQQGQSVAVIR
jgi:hypothetical protein